MLRLRYTIHICVVIKHGWCSRLLSILFLLNVSDVLTLVSIFYRTLVLRGNKTRKQRVQRSQPTKCRSAVLCVVVSPEYSPCSKRRRAERGERKGLVMGGVTRNKTPVLFSRAPVQPQPGSARGLQRSRAAF